LWVGLRVQDSVAVAFSGDCGRAVADERIEALRVGTGNGRR
jgi:hypothetical protein